MIELRNTKIAGSKGKPILLDVFYKNTSKPKPIIIFVHGFKGFKDWGHFNLMAKTMAEEGFVIVKFNFSYNGTTAEAPEDFNDLEAFGQNNFSIELNDLGLVIDHVLKSSLIPDHEALKDGVNLIGHSRGGGIAILKAGEDTRVKQLVTWASVAEFGRFWSKEVMEKWEKEGVLIVKNGRTKQKMPLYFQLYENYFADLDRLHIPTIAKDIDIPWLIIHGDQDEAVALSAARDLHAYNPRSNLSIIAGGNHTFGAKHPWASDLLSEHMQSVFEMTIKFIQKS